MIDFHLPNKTNESLRIHEYGQHLNVVTGLAQLRRSYTWGRKVMSFLDHMLRVALT